MFALYLFCLLKSGLSGFSDFFNFHLSIYFFYLFSVILDLKYSFTLVFFFFSPFRIFVAIFSLFCGFQYIFFLPILHFFHLQVFALDLVSVFLDSPHFRIFRRCLIFYLFCFLSMYFFFNYFLKHSSACLCFRQCLSLTVSLSVCSSVCLSLSLPPSLCFYSLLFL